MATLSANKMNILATLENLATAAKKVNKLIQGFAINFRAWGSNIGSHLRFDLGTETL